METNSKTKVVITHEYALVAAGIASTLSRHPDLEVAVTPRFESRSDADIIIGSCRCSPEAAKLTSRRSPSAATKSPKVLMVTTQESETEIRAAMDAGIHGCLSIDCAEDDLLAAIRGMVRASGSVLHAKAPVHSLSSTTEPLPSLPPRGGLAPWALRRVREYIDAHLDAEIQVKTLAEIAGFSVYHFARAFKQSMGVPPHRFVVERRLTRAAELIRDTDRSLSEIALEVGCSDQSHFTTLFRRFFGETPSVFRRARSSQANNVRSSEWRI